MTTSILLSYKVGLKAKALKAGAQEIMLPK
jgi:hypothetical protein